MINKNSLFGKREDTTPPQSSVRPAGYGMQPTSTAKTEASTMSIPKTETTTSSGDSTPSATSPQITSFVDNAQQGSKLIVGPGIKLKGAEIQDCDTLVVEGRVEATMDSRVIQIADQGSFAGKVNIDVAEIRGRFEGELTARKQLIIHATGHVTGTIRYGKIVIQEGGELTGDVKSISSGEGGSTGDLLDIGSKSFGAKSA